MSLISEGLKKAQLDAMRQDREQRQAYLRSATSPAPRRTRSHVPQMIAIGLASAVVAVAAVLWLTRAKTVTLAPVSPPPPAVVAVTKPAPPPPVTPTVAKAESTSSAGVSPAVRAPSRRPPSGGEDAAGPAAVTAALPPAKHRRDSFVEGETYASPINGPAGSTVNLTGIMAAGAESLAIINGSTVRPGAMIGPFVVERVERHRVALRYIDVHFYLTP